MKQLLLLTTLMFFFGCSKDEEREQEKPIDMAHTEVTAISIDKEELTLNAGESYKFIVSHIPSDAKLLDSDIIWSIHDIEYEYTTQNIYKGPSISKDGVITSDRSCTLLVDVSIVKGDGDIIGDQCKVTFTPSMQEIYEKYFQGFVVKDTTGLTVMGYNTLGENKDTIYLSGVREGKFWIGKFLTSTKTQIEEFIDCDKIDLARKIHTGYGNYEVFKITETEIHSFIKHNNGWIAEVRFYDPDRYEHNNNVFIFNTNNQSKKYYCYNWTYGVDIESWYNGSYIVNVDISKEYDNRSGIYTCFDYTGKPIFSQQSYYIIKGQSFPIDYQKVLYFESEEYTGVPSLYVSLVSIGNPNPHIWKTKFNIHLSLNYKYNVQLLSATHNTYIFQLNIIEFSGKKHSHQIEIDIKTGKYKEV